MDEIIYKLPKGIDLSQYIQDKSIAYYRVQYWGQTFYVPITKDMKKMFKMKIESGKILYSSFDNIKFGDMLRDIIGGIHLQIRDYVCSGIEKNLDQELREGFSKLFENYLHKRVKAEVIKKLPLQIEDKLNKK
jgi:coenzyme F420-reducing hydrogenase alpha subunit